eukprot:3900629-Rhodomonas_salina.1
MGDGDREKTREGKRVESGGGCQRKGERGQYVQLQILLKHFPGLPYELLVMFTLKQHSKCEFRHCASRTGGGT